MFVKVIILTMIGIMVVLVNKDNKNKEEEDASKDTNGST